VSMVLPLRLLGPKTPQDPTRKRKTMVKVKAPFGGISASGTLGGAFVFASTKGVQYARSHAVPSNPRSPLQVATRAMMAFLGVQWATMTTQQQDSWDAATVGAGASDFNAFVKANMKRFTQFTWPKIQSDQAAGTAPAMGTQTYTGEIGQISISSAVTTPNGLWGVAIAMSTGSGFTPARSNIVKVLSGTASPVTGVITGLAPGTYFLRSAGFNIGGTASSFTSESTGIVVG
jgi:hypothetical protein